MPPAMTDLWKRKLAAYLHDPADRFSEFGERDKGRAEVLVPAAGFWIADLWRNMGGSPVYSAAAVERLPFPVGRVIAEGRPRMSFTEPLP